MSSCAPMRIFVRSLCTCAWTYTCFAFACFAACDFAHSAYSPALPHACNDHVCTCTHLRACRGSRRQAVMMARRQPLAPSSKRPTAHCPRRPLHLSRSWHTCARWMLVGALCLWATTVTTSIPRTSRCTLSRRNRVSARSSSRAHETYRDIVEVLIGT